MKKFLLLLLSGAIFGACSDRAAHPALVTGVVMPPESRVFTPGDGVTVSAEGFEADDEIMFEIHWEEGAEGFAPNGCAKGVRGIVTARSAASVTFLAPGHYPASTATVLLFRRGHLMPLGKIRVADGVPESEALYGISDSDTDKTVIDRIDLSTGGVTPIETLGAGRGITCAVGLPGSGWICGVYSGSMVGFDLTMNYYNDFGYRSCLLAGQITDSSVGLISHDAGWLRLTTQTMTRTPSPAQVSWPVPDEVVHTLAVQPFVRVGSDLLLAQRNADGTCAPVVLRVSGGAGSGEAVEADAMVPFWTAVPSAADPDKMVQAGGYAVVEGGKDAAAAVRSRFRVVGRAVVRGGRDRAFGFGIRQRWQTEALHAVRGGGRAPDLGLRPAVRFGIPAPRGVRLFADRGGEMTAFLGDGFVFVRILRIFTG